MGEIMRLDDFRKKLPPKEKGMPKAPKETKREDTNFLSHNNYVKISGKILRIKNLSAFSEEIFQNQLDITKEYSDEALFYCIEDSSLDNWKEKPEFFKAVVEELSLRFEKYSSKK